MSHLPRLSGRLAEATLQRDLHGLVSSRTMYSSSSSRALRRIHSHQPQQPAAIGFHQRLLRTPLVHNRPCTHHHHHHQNKKTFHTSTPRRNLIEDPRYSPEKVAARAKYPVITAKDAAKKKDMPLEAKMLVRDFIDDSLYHPNYGYFSKQAVIFSPETDFEFEKIKDNMEFLDIIADKYREIEDDMDVRDEVARQVWHTPTELFKVLMKESVKGYCCSCGSIAWDLHVLTLYFSINVIALVRICDCQVHCDGIQAQQLPTQGPDYLRDGRRKRNSDDEHPRLHPTV